MTVNPKSLSSNATNTVAATTKSTKITKKIDMGAATNFGRDELGINSPTHRSTHAEEDLFATSNTTSVTTTNQADSLDDIFKTCSNTNALVSNTVSTQSNKTEDDFFNPREDESQEFGDFASAFGTSAPTTQPEKLLKNGGIITEQRKNEFADFSSAFESNQASSNTSNDPANLLFAINSTSNAQTTASNSNPKVGDLLTDLDGLSLDVSVPAGKLIAFSVFYFRSLTCSRVLSLFFFVWRLFRS